MYYTLNKSSKSKIFCKIIFNKIQEMNKHKTKQNKNMLSLLTWENTLERNNKSKINVKNIIVAVS